MKKIIIIIIILVFILSGCSIKQVPPPEVNKELYNNKEIKVTPCNTSGKREANVKVDVGYDSKYANREYYAYTNEYSQVVLVEAEEIILQSNTQEKVTEEDRYCEDEAKVDGVESDSLDEGHIIADSLGGVSNAYNITPQSSYQNRDGEQYQMEDEIRTALENGKEVTNFQAIISYSDNETQIPSSYYYSFEINGVEHVYSFENNDSKQRKNILR